MRHCIKCKASGWDVPSAENCVTTNIDTATNEVLDVSLDTVNIGVNYKF